MKVVLTESARNVVERVRERSSGPLSLVIGNGCCDGTAPYLFESYFAGPNERHVADVGGVEVLLDSALLELFDGREIVVDAERVACADSFSAESELGMRFTLDRLPAVSQSS
jgi:uncharacterized protein (DUF779 family)